MHATTARPAAEGRSRRIPPARICGDSTRPFLPWNHLPDWPATTGCAPGIRFPQLRIALDDVAVRVAAALAERYEILGLAGEGGMALVFRGRSAEGRDVAIKVFRPELSSQLTEARFLREAEIAGKLEHQGIVPVLESGTADDLLYFVMPYIEGGTLAARLRQEGPLPIDDVLRVTREVGAALSHAHEAGYIHRDVKPSNIMLGADGAKIADFGVARALSSAGGDRLTLSGFSVGTPRYMSPEQGAGNSSLDTRTDQYSLACVVFEMLVGEPPFTGPTAKAVIARHIGETPPSVGVVRPGTPGGVAAAVRRALAKNAADRYATVPDFIEALSAELPDPPSPSRRRRTIAIAAVAIVLAVVAFFLLRPRVGLDPNRVLVFAPIDTASAGGVNENVATYIGYVLEGTDPLRWEEARDWLDADVAPSSLASRERASVTRRAGARYFIDGTVLRFADSVTVVMRLWNAATDARVDLQGWSGPPDASEAKLGAIAVGQLLGSIIEPGRPIDLGDLKDRSQLAIAKFLQGEVEYRNTRFAAALERYDEAVEQDSAFAIAAVKGAQAAGWLEDHAAAAQLADLAIRYDSLLPAKYRSFIRGVQAYHAGRSDSALAELTSTTDRFPEWAEGWTALAEVYYHLMPDEANLDSLARASFDRALRLDTTFAPPLYHLAEMSIRDGDLDDARARIRRLEVVSPDRQIELQLELMIRCAESGPASIPWAAIADTANYAVLAAAQAMSPSPALRPCAEAAADAALRPGTGEAWGALFVLQSLLLAHGQRDSLLALLRSDRAVPLSGERLLLIDAVADPALATVAESVYTELKTGFEDRPSPALWLMLEWAAASGRTDDVRSLAAIFESRAASGQRVDSLFHGIAQVRLAAAEGDTDRALAVLGRLRPTGQKAGLVWLPWESLVAERLLHAELLAGRGSAEEARRIATEALSHRAVAELLFASLRTRLLASLAPDNGG